jgi:hypothetical protein
MIILLYEREHSERVTLLHPRSTNKFSMNRNPGGLIPRTHHTYLHGWDHWQHIQDDTQPFKYSLFKWGGLMVRTSWLLSHPRQ